MSLKVDVTDTSAVKKSMSIEVDPQAFDREMDQLVQSYAKQARLPGFRPGKAPKSVIRKKFARELDADVRERVMARYFREATEERGLRPVGEPIVDEVEHEDGQAFRFKTTFEVVPEFEVTGYREVEVVRGSDDVAESEIDKALEELRESRARLVSEEGRKASTGDYLVIDLKGTPEDEEAEPFEQAGTHIELGNSDNLPIFNEKLEGTAAGDELSFEVTYPDEYPAENLRGKSVKYELVVQEVKVRQLPDIDDEFAKDLGDFADLTALKARIRTDLEERREAEVDGQVRQALLDKVLVANPIPLPETMVELEMRQRLEDMARRMMMQGMDPGKMDLDWDELRKKQEEGARKSVHARLVLDAVARAEELAVSDAEVDQRLREDAEKMGESYEKVRATIEERSGLEVVRNQLVREKSLDLIRAVANIRSEE